MATEHEPNIGGTQPLEAGMQSLHRGELHTSGVPRTVHASGSGIATVLTSGLLAFLLGGAGAWTYLNYLNPILSKQRSNSGPASPGGADTNSVPIYARIDDLTGELSQLRNRIDTLPK